MPSATPEARRDAGGLGQGHRLRRRRRRHGFHGVHEIDAWYRRGPHTFADPARAIGIRFEPHVGGRLLEVHDAVSGEGLELGRIQVWEPGSRLVFTDRRGTEVEVRFEPCDGQTRVTLEHRGLERLAPGVAVQVSRHGWRLLLPWYAEHMTGTRSPTPTRRR